MSTHKRIAAPNPKDSQFVVMAIGTRNVVNSWDDDISDFNSVLTLGGLAKSEETVFAIVTQSASGTAKPHVMLCTVDEFLVFMTVCNGPNSEQHQAVSINIFSDGPIIAVFKVEPPWATPEVASLDKNDWLQQVLLSYPKMSNPKPILDLLSCLLIMSTEDNRITMRAYNSDTVSAVLNAVATNGQWPSQLVLEGNHLTEFPKEIRGSHVGSISLAHNRIASIGGSVLPPGLTQLDLHDTEISDFSFLKQCPNLTFLDLTYTRISPTPETLRMLSSLKKLRMLFLPSDFDQHKMTPCYADSVDAYFRLTGKLRVDSDRPIAKKYTPLFGMSFFGTPRVSVSSLWLMKEAKSPEWASKLPADSHCSHFF